jgi:hypothetical protein
VIDLRELSPAYVCLLPGGNESFEPKSCESSDFPQPHPSHRVMNCWMGSENTETSLPAASWLCVFAVRQDSELWGQSPWIMWFPPASSPKGWWTAGRCLRALRLSCTESESLSSPPPGRTQCSIFSPHPLMHSGNTLRLRWLLPWGTKWGASGNLTGPQAAKHFAASSSSWHTKKGSFYSDSSLEAENWPLTNPAFNPQIAQTSTLSSTRDFS